MMAKRCYRAPIFPEMWPDFLGYCSAGELFVYYPPIKIAVI
jgi:hypothetical protein